MVEQGLFQKADVGPWYWQNRLRKSASVDNRGKKMREKSLKLTILNVNDSALMAVERVYTQFWTDTYQLAFKLNINITKVGNYSALLRFLSRVASPEEVFQK